MQGYGVIHVYIHTHTPLCNQVLDTTNFKDGSPKNVQIIYKNDLHILVGNKMVIQLKQILFWTPS